MLDGEGPGSSLTGFAFDVFRELCRYLSEPNCRAMMSAAAVSAGVPVRSLEASHLPVIVAQIDKTFSFFGVRPELKSRCLTALQALARGSALREDVLVPIVKEDDVVAARTTGREMGREIGFSEVGYVKIATAISELGRNILKYAGKGQITIRRLAGDRDGLEVVATDQGPGIADVELVLSPRYRSRSGMGVGLRGTRRLMDHFEITSHLGRGTTVTIRKFRD